MDFGDFVFKPLKDFSKNSIRLVKRCTKPDKKGAGSACQRTDLSGDCRETS